MSAISLQHWPRFWRTIRQLQPSQVGWRLRYVVQRRLEAQPWYRLAERIERRIDAGHAVLQPPHFQLPSQSPVALSGRVSELRAGKLTLLNETRSFAGGVDWRLNDAGRSHRLWNFSLHYHAWLRDLARDYALTRDETNLRELKRWLIDWLENCSLDAVGSKQNPWNSFNIGERLRHWRQIDALVPKSFWDNAALSRARFLHSAAMQAEYLAAHIEWDLRGNHLFKDAVGLAVAADMLAGSAGARWRTHAEELTLSQLAEQILPDGMHFERSPMYHIHVMEDLLTLQILLPDERVQAALRDALQRMADPLRWLTHLGGRYPLFNDAADHAVANPDEVLEELARRGIAERSASPFGLKHLEFAGIVAWHGEPWSVFFDVGRIGPDCQPGHAHADSLNVICSFDGLPLVVDPGTYCYDDDDRRKYDRSTAAHNTVCLNETDSSEVWHIFRVGRRAEPAEVSVFDRDDGFAATASHTGYDHLSGSPRHRRRVSLGTFDQLEIHDEIIGSEPQRALGGFLLAPEWTATTTSTGWKLHHRHCSLHVELNTNQSVQTEVVSRPWHPEFGQEILTQRIQWSARITPPFRISTTWQRG
jgi:uncharacterized heparinase superfamily protein